MTGKQLRNSILQWAIQGKLVPQDPNDEPASVLLQRIREEKSRLVKEGKIKRDKNETIIYRGDDNSYYEKTLATGAVRCIDEEIPFELPSSWEWCRLGFLSNLHIGKTPPRGESIYWSNGIYPWVSISDIQDGRTITHTKEKVSKEAATKIFKGKYSPKGSLIMSFKLSIGKVAILGIDAYHNEAIITILPHYDNPTMREYLKRALPIFSQIGDSKDAIKGKTLNSSSLANLMIPLPPIAEQQRIVEKIEVILPVIDKYSIYHESLNNLNNQIYSNLRKSILQEAIQGKLTPQLEAEGTAEELLAEIRTEKERLVKEGKLKKSALASESRIFRADDNKYYEQIGTATVDITNELPFDIPSKWRWCRLGYCADLQIGKTPARGETAYWSKGKYPWVSISDIIDGEVLTRTKEKISEYAATKVFKGRYSTKGSLIMSFKLTIGKIAILGIDAYHNEAIVTIQPYNSNHIILEYFKYILPIFAQMGDSKDAIKGKTLNSSSLMNLLIPLPPIAEQQRITERIIALSKFLK